MKLSRQRSVIKLLFVLVVISIIVSYLLSNVLFQPTKEELMAKHFPKASIYEAKKSKPKPQLKSSNASKETLKENVNFKRVPGGIKSLDNVLPANVNRWKKTNDLQLSSKSNIVIPLNKTCEPQNYTTYQTKSYCLKHDSFLKYFSTQDGKKYCLTNGTAFYNHNRSSCHCNFRWHGSACSMPNVVYRSNYPMEFGFKYQNPPRRLIHAFPFTHEFDLLETRFHEYGDLVDLYIIVESNYTASGQPKPRYLKAKLDKGAFHEFQPRILYVPLDYFPRQAYYNGWIIDALLRNHMAEHGLALIENLRGDDVFLLTDADELPVKETLMFLKLHMSYPEPVGLYITHNVYGFQWLGEDVMTHVFGACSIR